MVILIECHNSKKEYNMISTPTYIFQPYEVWSNPIFFFLFMEKKNRNKDKIFRYDFKKKFQIHITCINYKGLTWSVKLI